MNALDWPFPGSRWWKFDFHTHTPASSDYGAGLNQAALKLRTPREWLIDYIHAGIECVAITDHNCGDWIDPLKVELAKMRSEGVAGAEKLHLFPGVELTINGAHFLAIFGPAATTRTIQDLLAIARYNGDAANAQGYCVESVSTIYEEVLRLGGIFIPAHVDLDQTGIFKLQTNASALGPIFKLDGILAMEVAGTGYTPPPCYSDAKLRWASVLGSDSHHPSAPSAPLPGKRISYPGSHWTWVKMGAGGDGAPTLESLRLALHDGNAFSLKRSDACLPGYDPNMAPELWIESLSVSKARLMGNGKKAEFRFSPWMNAVIGGRGSGKSTLIHFLRLTTKRDGDLNLIEGQPDNRVKATFDNFVQIGSDSKPGGLRADTVAELVIRKSGQRFMLQWQQSDRGVTVSEWDEDTRSWNPASSQDVVERFPVRLFSQDEIAMIAERPEALLRRVDESITKAEWRARNTAVENQFVELLGKIRSLRTRLAEKDRLVGQRDDLIKQLAAFEKSEHAKIRQTFQKASRQKREAAALLEAFRDLSARVGSLRDDLLLHDLPEGLIDPADPGDQELQKADTLLRHRLAKAVNTLSTVAADMSKDANSTEAALASSTWGVAVKAAEAAHENLMNSLKAQGVTDPAAYSNLLAKRQVADKQLKEIEGTEAEINKLTAQAQECLTKLLALRAELRTLRERFLTQELQGNRYVRINLIPFGHEGGKNQIEAEIRRDLQCADARFASAIRNRDDGTGFVEQLYVNLPTDEAGRTEEILKRIQAFKQQVFTASRGKQTDLPGQFSNYLVKAFKERPEALDRFRMWWPEDALVVSYSRNRDGDDFVQLSSGASAGERAAALLAFFLAHGNTPLIIDQPENDLDNHLITDLVVAQLQNNIVRRQIIVVTHNPNIVVNGDAELVHAMEFKSGQCRAKVSGALQDDAVRSEVCAVMEGGKTALKSRFERLI
jgi:energy-coupling factor transporter ATP-binding protein EcfA2